MASARTTAAPGRTKRRPAIRPPIVPRRRQPDQVANCIASGPGRSMQKDRAER